MLLKKLEFLEQHSVKTGFMKTDHWSAASSLKREK
jgi:hypothetical protein